MNDMSKGFFGRFRRGHAADTKVPAAGVPAPAKAAAPPEASEDEAGDLAFELAFDIHFCCICGAPLGFDLEDEIDGEGPGRDICGACNRTRNDEAMMWWCQ